MTRSCSSALMSQRETGCEHPITFTQLKGCFSFNTNMIAVQDSGLRQILRQEDHRLTAGQLKQLKETPFQNKKQKEG